MKPTSYTSGAAMNHPPKIVVSVAAGGLTASWRKYVSAFCPAKTSPTSPLVTTLPTNACGAPPTSGVIVAKAVPATPIAAAAERSPAPRFCDISITSVARVKNPRPTESSRASRPVGDCLSRRSFILPLRSARMHYARFRDPAGSVREGQYDPETETVAFGGEEYAFDDPTIDVLPPTEPSKIVCVGRNYAD